MKIRIVSLRGATWLAIVAGSCATPRPAVAQQSTASPATAEESLPAVVVTATREELGTDRVPSAVTVITGEEMARHQYRFVSDALRTVPGLSIVQTGTPGQLTSVFTRGLPSDATQVMIDGIPINQGLAGLFNFADMTADNVERIEVVRGPQSTIYGPRAGGGVVNIITKRGDAGLGGGVSFEGGTFNTFRESGNIAGRSGIVDYSAAASRLDTDNARPNNQYRSTSALANLGINPPDHLRLGVLATYSLADTGNPNSIFDPRPRDNLLTERWLVAPSIDYQPFAWWKHRLIVDYDEERQVNNPNDDGFVGATRALFRRYQLDYQNHLDISRWLRISSGVFYSRVEAEQERPAVLFGPTLISDKTENEAAFVQLQLQPLKNLLLVASGRYDHFSQFGEIETYRLAGSYKLAATGTVLRASLATGFIPPSSQDKIFGDNFALEPNKTKGFDIGFEQVLWGDRLRFGANYFHNDLTNVIGFDGLFRTLNLGSARTQGVEIFLNANPLPDLSIAASYTYLETEKTSSLDIQQPQGARLPRRPRNELFASINYRWFHKLTTGLEVKYVNAREELNFGAPNFDIPDYTVARLVAEYELNRQAKIIGRIENLTDEKYAEVFGFPNLGRAFYGGVSLEF